MFLRRVVIIEVIKMATRTIFVPTPGFGLRKVVYSVEKDGTCEIRYDQLGQRRTYRDENDFNIDVKYKK